MREKFGFAARCIGGVVAPILCIGAACGQGLVQSSVRSWGGCYYDTESRYGACTRVSAGPSMTALLRSDGRLFMQGENIGISSAEVPRAPSGLTYVDVSTSGIWTVGLLSDGTVEIWGDSSGSPRPPVPALPVGVRYVGIAAGGSHALLLRSDHAIIALGNNFYGQCNVPTFLPGQRPVRVAAGGALSLALLSDGSLAAWGGMASGQVAVPPLPTGMTYVDVAVSDFSNIGHVIALRSDGMAVAWGDNTYGQCNVPPLLGGTSYKQVACGAGHSQAWRSDGVFVAWGFNGNGQTNVPVVPAGMTCKQLESGPNQTVALMADGRVLGWGYDTVFVLPVPDLPRDSTGSPLARHAQVACGSSGYAASVMSDGSLQMWGIGPIGHPGVASPPPGVNGKYVRVGVSGLFSVALRSDGSLVAWGDNTDGRTNVPPLPPGVRYSGFAICFNHTVALRTDGQAVHFGTNAQGEGNIPALPPGLRYVKADVEKFSTLLLRSDGILLALGALGSLPGVSPLPAGLQYVDLAATYYFAAALRSDGSIAFLGANGVPPVDPNVNTPYWSALPPLPAGVVYVALSGGEHHLVARRSDGQVVVCGHGLINQHHVPPLEPGSSYLEVDASWYSTIARVGPTSTYITIADGCAGSRPATRLIPRDTPRIGAPLEVGLLDLPANLALVALGWQRTQPLSLVGLGMPGCNAHITVDDVSLVTGQIGSATLRLDIPNSRWLVGMHFYHQAIVLDPAAGNAAGAVVSNAAEGVIGYP